MLGCDLLFSLCWLQDFNLPEYLPQVYLKDLALLEVLSTDINGFLHFCYIVYMDQQRMKIRLKEIESHSESNHFSARKTDDSLSSIREIATLLGIWTKSVSYCSLHWLQSCSGQNESEVLNYGVTFPVAGHEKALEELDTLLGQYTCFSSPTLVHGDKQKEKFLEKSREAEGLADLSVVSKEHKVSSTGECGPYGGMVVPAETVSSDPKKVVARLSFCYHHQSFRN